MFHGDLDRRKSLDPLGLSRAPSHRRQYHPRKYDNSARSCVQLAATVALLVVAGVPERWAAYSAQTNRIIHRGKTQREQGTGFPTGLAT
jgi:hypothetical protein